MVIHERVLYVGEAPGDYREVSGPVDCHFDRSELSPGVSPDFDGTRFDIIVFRPQAALTREEALACIRALLAIRPVVAEREDELRGPAGIAMRVRGRELRVHGRPVALTHREFELLRLLLKRQDEVLTADEISRAIWWHETFGSRNYVEAHISRLRAKLAKVGAYAMVTTLRGVGYTIRAEDARSGRARIDAPMRTAG